MVVVAQLVRVSVCGTECRGFESRLPPKIRILFRNEKDFFVYFYKKSITVVKMTTDILRRLYESLMPFIHTTPIMTSRLANEKANATIFFKCENFQKTGSYKIRGATNAILQLTDFQKERGVVTHSSGNFGQALAFAAQQLGVSAYIVMPASAPLIKKEAVLSYGGIIEECAPTLKAREKASQRIQLKTKATFIHPSNDINVIHGQGTACYELLQEQPDLDFIICPVGGGGLISGTALFVNEFARKCKVIGAEPFEVDDAYRSLQSGKIEGNITTNTIADGLKTQLGNKSFPIIKEHVSTIIRVTENEIVEAMFFIWNRMKIIVEPSSAVSFAAVLRDRKKFENKKIGIILSGGNVDVEKLPF